MKRFIITLAVAASLTAAAYGAAAALIIQDTPTLQVGATSNGLACDPDGILIHLTTDGATVTPSLDNVTIKDIHAACDGKKIRLDFFNSSDQFKGSWNPVLIPNPSGGTAFLDGPNIADAQGITKVVATLYDE
jgi:hypothetical protein